MAAEKSSDAWIIFFVDLFVNSIGCVLMLMVLGLRNAHPTTQAKKGGGPDAIPVLMSVSWSANPPVSIDLRVRQQVNGVWQEVPASQYRNIDLSGRAASGVESTAAQSVDRRRGRLVLFDAAPRSSYQVQARIGVEAPIQQTTLNRDPYEKLVRSLEEAWTEVGKNRARYADLATRIQKISHPYLRLQESLDKFRQDWLQHEERWRTTPGTDAGSRAAEMVGVRLQMATGLLQNALKEGWDFPSAEFFAEFRPAAPGQELRAVEFEAALTRLMLSQYSDTQEDWRRQWIAGQLQMLEPSFALPLTITLAAPGAKELMEKPHHLKDIFQATPEASGWRNLTVARVDARGRVSMDSDPDLTVDDEAVSAPPKADLAQKKAVPVSHWEAVFRKYEANPDDTMLPRIDKALEFLAQQSKGTAGEFPSRSKTSENNGPAVTGLCLMAFVSRGHLVNQPGSPYRQVTKKALENLLTVLPKVSNEKWINSYHHGFATMALAQAYPGLKRNGPEALANQCLEELRRSVDAIFELQGKTSGGWGYTAERDDSSVSCVMIKAINDARPFLAPDRKPHVERSLAAAAEFMKGCYVAAHGTFRYRRSDETEVIDGGECRQGGCMLAQHLCETRNLAPGSAARYSDTALKRLLDWKPDPTAIDVHSHSHYGLFYAGHAMLHAEPSQTAAWFRWSRQLFRDIGQQHDGHFGGDTYGTAMAVILLTLPARHELERLGRPNTFKDGGIP